MKVIFLEDVSHKGRKGEVKEVAGGYARNYLIPNKLAVMATASALKTYQVQVSASAHRRIKEGEDLKDLMQKIEGKSIKFKAKAGGKDRIHGSITSADIAGELSKLIDHDIDKKRILLSEPLRKLGDFEVKVSYSKDNEAKITVTIEEESSPDA
jgi:large subunit ribosomal protein L9